jgi:carboxyl-terminal processing protease
MVINSMDPYRQVAIIGTDTFGKPVGQDAFDLSGCDTRLRLVTFRTVNALERGDYYNGLASRREQLRGRRRHQPAHGRPCRSLDRGRAAVGRLGLVLADDRRRRHGAAEAGPEAERRYPVPERPDPAQFWLPGLF